MVKVEGEDSGQAVFLADGEREENSVDVGQTDPSFDEGGGQEGPHGGGGGGAAAGPDELLGQNSSLVHGLCQGHRPGDQGWQHRGEDSSELPALAGME